MFSTRSAELNQVSHSIQRERRLLKSESVWNKTYENSMEELREDVTSQGEQREAEFEFGTPLLSLRGGTSDPPPPPSTGGEIRNQQHTSSTFPVNAGYFRQGLACTLGSTNDLTDGGRPRAKNGF